jgi:DNA replication protein DnaC
MSSPGDIFARLAAEAAAFAPDTQVVRRSESDARAERRARLHDAGCLGPLPEEDVERLVAGTCYRTEALDLVRQWYHQRPHIPDPFCFLVMFGEQGVGKTVSGFWLLGELGGRYVTAEQLRKRARGDTFRDRQWFEEMLKARVLVIDDAGTEMNADEARSVMFEVVHHRQGLPNAWTLLPTNISAEEFVERYDERTVARLRHLGRFASVEGPDRRRRG